MTDPAKVQPPTAAEPLSPLRWIWAADDRHVFRRCLDCDAEVWAFGEGLICSNCGRDEDNDDRG